MKILFNTTQYLTNKSNISFEKKADDAYSSVDILYKEISKLAPDFNDPKEREKDIELAKEIQKLRKRHAEAQKNALKENDLAKKSEMLKLASALEVVKDDLVIQLAQRHFKLAFFLANEFCGGRHKHNFDDTISVANLGVIKAAERFDPEKSPNTNFSTYARYWIRSYIDMNMAKDVQVYVPRGTKRRFQDAKEAGRILGEKLKREPSDEEITQYLGKKSARYTRAILNSAQVSAFSLDAPYLDNDDRVVADFLTETATPHPSMVKYDEKALSNMREIIDKHLTPRERQIISLRFKLDNDDFNHNTLVSCRNVAENFNLSGERIRQIQHKIIEKIRNIYEKYYM